MKGIDPKWAMYLGLLVTIEQAIGHGTVSLTNLVPDSWAPYITSWCNFLAFIGTAVMTYQAAVSAPLPGPAANTPISPTAVARVLLVAFILSLFLAGVPAMAQTRRPALTGNLPADIRSSFEKTTGVKATGDVPFDLLKALDKALLPDLQYAQKLAVATGSKVTAPCYGAWIDMINTQQTAVQTKNADGTATDTPTPDPHLVTDFERMVELRNALQPDSPFMTACSPVANMVKMDVTNFMGIVISGGAGLATLVPGL
jgi:hypothetical protein